MNKYIYDEKGIQINDLAEEYIIEAFKERTKRVNGTWKETKDEIVRQGGPQQNNASDRSQNSILVKRVKKV